MRTIHILHLHKPDWGHLRERLDHTVHNPLFWALLILALILIAMIFFAALGPAVPRSGPYTPTPIFPYIG